MESSIDLQCQKIHLGIIGLLSLLDNPLANHTLEIKSSIQSRDNYNFVSRLEKSIEQYIKRDKNLFYVGLLGHYSSGKSSTINSLLGLKQTVHARKEDNNPTDTMITMITGQKNNDLIIKSVTTGRIPVVVTPLDNIPFLDHIVIMDTPGSGDPLLMEEVVRDSLPLADLIIYCISAATPLTSADIPLLKEKEKNLGEIPTLYVIIRGDEFKVNKLKELSNENFDFFKSKQVLSQLAARMKEIFSTIDLSAEDFIVIDNHDAYNIDILRQVITSKSDAANFDNLIQLHSHKVAYFIRSAKEIKLYFSNFIQGKLHTIQSFFQKAQQNVLEYDEKTKIGTDKLNVDSKTAERLIIQIIDGNLNENLRVSGLLTTPAFFRDIDVISRWMNENLPVLDIQSKSQISQLKAHFERQIYDQKEKYKNYLFEALEKNEKVTKENAKRFLSIFSLKSETAYLETTIDLRNKYHLLNKDLIGYFQNDRFSNLKRNCDSVLARLKGHNPVDGIQKTLEQVDKSLSEIFHTYKEGVKIYSIAAFSNEAKTYIRQLGLNEELDKLDAEEVNIEEFKKISYENIFQDYYTKVESFKSQCSVLAHQIQSLNFSPGIDEEIEVDKQLDKIKISIDFDKNDLVAQKLAAIYQEAETFLINKIDEIHSRFHHFDSKMFEAKENLRKRRRAFYFRTYIPALLVLMLTILFFIIFPKFQTFQNLGTAGNWVLGIIVNATTFFLTEIFRRSKDKYPKAEARLTEQTKFEKKVDIGAVIEDKFYDVTNRLFNIFSEQITALILEKNKIFLRQIWSEALIKNLHDSHGILTSNENMFKLLIGNYSKELNLLKQVISRVLNNNIRNTEILFQQSKLIKEKAINPSFDLLEKTKNEIHNVMLQIKEIEFS